VTSNESAPHHSARPPTEIYSTLWCVMGHNSDHPGAAAGTSCSPLSCLDDDYGNTMYTRCSSIKWSVNALGYVVLLQTSTLRSDDRFITFAESPFRLHANTKLLSPCFVLLEGAALKMYDLGKNLRK